MNGTKGATEGPFRPDGSSAVGEGRRVFFFSVILREGHETGLSLLCVVKPHK